MKNFLRASLIGMAIALAAGGAQAATLNHNFKCDSGYVFQIDNALNFKQVSGAVEVTAASGTTYSYPDASGACYTKLVNASVGTFVNIPGTLEYISTVSPLYILCYSSGTQTGFAYAGSIQPRFIPDSCALYNSIKALSN